VSDRKVLNSLEFWLSLIIVILIVLLALGSYFDLYNEITEIRIGGLTLHHWFTIGGTLFIAIFTPIYYFAKRRYLNIYKTIVSTHVFGNMIAIALISIHFAHQMGRPEQFYPDLATGIILYPTVILQFLTGFTMKFKLIKDWKYTSFLHKSLTVTFYLAIVVHILHGFRII